jgi:hypothetical protein
MRKSRRSIPWEEPSAGSSNNKLDTDIDDLDEEIIDLEEIVEPGPDAVQEDDDLAFDVEILNEEAGLGFGDFESKIESEDDFLLEDDLLKELPFFQDLKAEPEVSAQTAVAKEKAAELALDLLLGSAEGALDEAAAEGVISAPEAAKPEEFALSPALETGETFLDDGAGGGEPVPVEEAKPEDHGEPTVPAAEASVSLDEFVGRMESRLVEAVREIVESRLPEIVRRVLREEIERMKDDQEPEA